MSSRRQLGCAHAAALVLMLAATDLGAQCSPSWMALGSGVNGDVSDLVAMPNGDIIAGGWFTTAGGVSASGVARWDGAAWSPLGSGIVIGGWDYVAALTTLANGDLVVGGDFTTAGGVTANNIARWNGSNWAPLGTGTSGTWHDVLALTTLPNGDLIAGGYFTSAGGLSANRIARWNGSSWAPLGSGIGGSPDAVVTGLAILPNGDVIAGGYFSTAGGASANNIARWNGSNWAPLGSGISGDVYGLAVLPTGDLVAAGMFSMAGGVIANNIASWNGSSWAPLGSGMNSLVGPVAIMSNGDLVAGGYFTTAGGVSANRIARWDGSSWAGIGTGMTGTGVYALAVTPGNELVAGGFFTAAGGVPANHIARWTTTCTATAVPYGNGCGSPALVLSPVANARPIIGTTAQASLSNIPSTLAFVAGGWSQTQLGTFTLPLSLASYGMPGCDLLQSTDASAPVVISASGTGPFSLPVPNSSGLLGLKLYLQGWAYAPGANAGDMIVSNGIEWVIGNT